MKVEVPREITRSLQDASSLAMGGAHSAALDEKMSLLRLFCEFICINMGQLG
jgi:hypothetical protein